MTGNSFTEGLNILGANGPRSLATSRDFRKRFAHCCLAVIPLSSPLLMSHAEWEIQESDRALCTRGRGPLCSSAYHITSQHPPPDGSLFRVSFILKPLGCPYTDSPTPPRGRHLVEGTSDACCMPCVVRPLVVFIVIAVVRPFAPQWLCTNATCVLL